MKVNDSGDNERQELENLEKGSLNFGKREKGAKSGSLNEKENALGHQNYLRTPSPFP